MRDGRNYMRWEYPLTGLEAIVRYECEQGMIKKKFKIEELFFPPRLQEIQSYV